MKVLQVGGIIVATAITAACLTAMGKKVIDVRPSAVAESEVSKEWSSDIAPLAMPEESPNVEPLTLSEETPAPKRWKHTQQRQRTLYLFKGGIRQDYKKISHYVKSNRRGWKRMATTSQFGIIRRMHGRKGQTSRTFLIILMPNSHLKESRRTSF